MTPPPVVADPTLTGSRGATGAAPLGALCTTPDRALFVGPINEPPTTDHEAGPGPKSATWSGRRTSAARRSSHGDYLHDELLGAAFVAGLHGTLLGWSGGADGGAVAAVEHVDGADEREFHDSGLLSAGSARRVGRGVGDVAHPGFRADWTAASQG